MKELTAKNVHETFIDCLFKDGENHDNFVAAEGLTNNVGFHPERLESHREEIHDYLMQLPHEFRDSVGGGYSFLQMPLNDKGEQWCDQKTAQELLLMGIGIKEMEYLLPRVLWRALPGSVPYIKINGV